MSCYEPCCRMQAVAMPWRRFVLLCLATWFLCFCVGVAIGRML
jgi:hypothetical protein